MTVLFSGELVSLSNTADVPSGGAWWIKHGGSVCHSFLPLAPTMGRKSHFFQRNHRASESVEKARGRGWGEEKSIYPWLWGIWKTLLPPYSTCWYPERDILAEEEARSIWGQGSSEDKGTTQ